VKNTHLVILAFLMQFIDMGMKDPLPTFTTLVERVRDAHPKLALIHIVEPRVDGIIDLDLDDENLTQSNDALREARGARPYMTAGGMSGVTANKMVEKYGGLVAFGRHFIANVSRVFVGWWSHFSQQIVARCPFAPEGRSLADAL
jgi:2,4-dienoyl-CoA reductase-like NADH-dependent reductase (Old Yellow Enzyme family)